MAVLGPKLTQTTDQYTPPTPTRRNCRVASRRRYEHTRRQSWPSLQFPLLTNGKWRHNDVIVKKIVKIHEYYTTNILTCSVIMLRHIVLAIGCRIVNWDTADGCVVRSHRRIRRQSSRIHVHTADADATRRDKTVSSRRRRRCVLGLRDKHLKQNSILTATRVGC